MPDERYILLPKLVLYKCLKLGQAESLFMLEEGDNKDNSRDINVEDLNLEGNNIDINNKLLGLARKVIKDTGLTGKRKVIKDTELTGKRKVVNKEEEEKGEEEEAFIRSYPPKIKLAKTLKLRISPSLLPNRPKELATNV
ncbi:hypothetical protein K504DRAFT_450416 [Pleomassaria siparia CBS 279.74]|uniref:Uncharacterized protein n=1 Tax=Pleomassaria siparia CBS 279.74 TaxID=1314801 RepID=A0A6G1KN00_9PLEO|nr:hypothetical protein K504DRAFT_450416 [Pleomassaria siparia CBS 279.74]